MLDRQQQEHLNPESDPDIPTQQFTFQYAVITDFEELSTGFLGLDENQLIPKITYHQASTNYVTQDLGNGVSNCFVGFRVLSVFPGKMLFHHSIRL